MPLVIKKYHYFSSNSNTKNYNVLKPRMSKHLYIFFYICRPMRIHTYTSMYCFSHTTWKLRCRHLNTLVLFHVPWHSRTFLSIPTTWLLYHQKLTWYSNDIVHIQISPSIADCPLIAYIFFLVLDPIKLGPSQLNGSGGR